MKQMDYAVYEHSLGVALVPMLFFAAYFLAGKTPDKPLFAPYVRSRRIMGAALLVLCANYSVHLFGSLRSLHPGAAILMNLSTYFLVYWLFSAALTVLSDRYVFLWVLSSIPFYIYLYWSYMNYLLFYEQVESILEHETPASDLLAGSCT